MVDRRGVSRVLSGLSGLPRAFVDPASLEPDSELADGAPSAVELAFQEGRREGMEAGAAQAAEVLRAEYDTLRSGVAETIAGLIGVREETTRRHQADMFDLALAAASRMLREKIDQDDPVAARALQEALAALPGDGTVKARLHPDDIESIRRELAREIEGNRVALTADDAVSRGGCIVDGTAGSIDAGLETAVAQVTEAAAGKSPT